MQKLEVGKTDDADRVKDGKDSPEPMEADQNMRQLKSRDFPPGKIKNNTTLYEAWLQPSRLPSYQLFGAGGVF